MKAVILARVSTKEQEEYGHSLEAQVRRLRDYAASHNMEVVQEYAFSESAGTKIRKKFEEVLDYFRRHTDVRTLLCMNVDRVTRNFRDAVDLDDMRVKDNLTIHFVQDGFVLSANSSGVDLFMWETKVFIAKQYINRLADDAKRSMDHKVRNGEWIAKAPVGYRNAPDPTTGKNTVLLDETRAFHIKRLFEEYATGMYSLREMAARLKNWGLTNSTKLGKPLTVKQVHEIIQNPFYYGYMRIKGELHPHKYNPIIDYSTFQQCQKIRNRGRAVPFKRESYPFVFRGLLKCAHCGCSYSSELNDYRRLPVGSSSV